MICHSDLLKLLGEFGEAKLAYEDAYINLIEKLIEFRKISEKLEKFTEEILKKPNINIYDFEIDG